MEPRASTPRTHGLGRALGLLAAGAALSLAGFFFAREAHRKQVEAEFRAAAQDHAEAVGLGLKRGFETVLILRDHFTASGEFDVASFRAFTGPALERHPYIQALQWLPEVTPDNRAELEAKGRGLRPDFRFFRRDAQGNRLDLPPGKPFYAVFFVEPERGNEVALGYSAMQLETRQAMIRKAVATGQLSSSGRIRLIQESGEQWGLLVGATVRAGRGGRPPGLVQGVFRCGDLVSKSLAFLEPKGLEVSLLDASAPEGEALLHFESSRLPSVGPVKGELRFSRSFDLAGRTWEVLVQPAGGHFLMTAGLRAWAVLCAGLAFTILLAVYLRNLRAQEAEIRAQVEARTRDLAQETESHRRDAQALAVAEARYRQLVQVMGEGMWVLDPRGETTFVNRRMEEMLGVPDGAMTGRKFHRELVLGHARPNHLGRTGIPPRSEGALTGWVSATASRVAHAHPTHLGHCRSRRCSKRSIPSSVRSPRRCAGRSACWRARAPARPARSPTGSPTACPPGSMRRPRCWPCPSRPVPPVRCVSDSARWVRRASRRGPSTPRPCAS